MDVGVNSYNMQIATMRMTKLAENWGTERGPAPFATVSRDVGDLEYYDRTHTLYAPMERVDMFVTWNYRRDREGRKDYRGGILWHEGEIRFKKDCTLQGAVPIPLLMTVARRTWPRTWARPSSSPTRTAPPGSAWSATKRSRSTFRAASGRAAMRR